MIGQPSVGQSRRREGSVFVVALIALFVLLVLGLVFIEFGTNSAVNAARQREATKALMLADAAVDYAAWAFQESYGEGSNVLGFDPSAAPFVYTSPVITVGTGTFQYRAVKPYRGSADLIGVTTTGATAHHGTQQQILAVMRPMPLVPAVFDHVIFSDHNLRLGGDTVADGNPALGGGGVHANGNIRFIGTSYKVIGDCSATGTIEGGDNVSGTESQYAPHVPMPEIDIEGYRNLADVVYVGDMTFNNADFGLGTLADPKIIFVEGQVSISGNITGVGIIVSTEGFQVTGNIAYSDEGSALAMLTSGDFSLQGTADIVGLIYAHNVTCAAEFGGTGTPHVYGAIVADVVTVNGTIDATWDPRVKAIKGLPGHEGQIDVISWERL